MLVVTVLDETRVKVIHYTSPADSLHSSHPESLQTLIAVSPGCSGCGYQCELAQIQEQEVVLRPSMERIELLEYDMMCTIHEGMNAVERARLRIGERKYNLLFNNCESFVNWVKIDEATSKQVTDAVFAFGVGAVFGFFIAIGGTWLNEYLGSLNSSKKNK